MAVTPTYPPPPAPNNGYCRKARSGDDGHHQWVLDSKLTSRWEEQHCVNCRQHRRRIQGGDDKAWYYREENAAYADDPPAGGHDHQFIVLNQVTDHYTGGLGTSQQRIIEQQKCPECGQERTLEMDERRQVLRETRNALPYVSGNAGFEVNKSLRNQLNGVSEAAVLAQSEMAAFAEAAVRLAQAGRITRARGREMINEGRKEPVTRLSSLVERAVSGKLSSDDAATIIIEEIKHAGSPGEVGAQWLMRLTTEITEVIRSSQRQEEEE